jgi:hypothetical protein
MYGESTGIPIIMQKKREDKRFFAVVVNILKINPMAKRETTASAMG